jgi:hypothetical protein
LGIQPLVLDINENDMTSKGLDDITRLSESTPRLKSIVAHGNERLFRDGTAESLQRFVPTLRHKNATLQAMVGTDKDHDFPKDNHLATLFASTKNSLTRNRELNNVGLLLTPPPSRQPPPRPGSSLLLLKVHHEGIAEYAKVAHNNAGASAIFKLFTARPQLLEKRLQRPAAASTAAAVVASDAAYVAAPAAVSQLDCTKSTNSNNDDNHSIEASKSSPPTDSQQPEHDRFSTDCCTSTAGLCRVLKWKYSMPPCFSLQKEYHRAHNF